MKAILDTCVVIDFLQKREPFAPTALQIFRAAAGEQFTGCITAKSATDIYYLTHRCTHSDEKARSILNGMDIPSVRRQYDRRTDAYFQTHSWDN